MVTLSIVSHGQHALTSRLLSDLTSCEGISSIILTQNIPEPLFDIPALLKKKVLVTCNSSPKGFGDNHNAAFALCKTPYFCVINPDVRISKNPFLQLIESLRVNQVAMCAPVVVNSNGDLEDSIRLFPTPLRLLIKVLTGKHVVQSADSNIVFPHWVAGMFMLFDSKAFQLLNGFDERYFLYYEDVDICARIWQSNMRLLVNKQVGIVHDAQRSSHRKLKYLRWHLTSMCRFFRYHLGHLPNPDLKTGLPIRD